jgi:hypothetical protein
MLTAQTLAEETTMTDKTGPFTFLFWDRTQFRLSPNEVLDPDKAIKVEAESYTTARQTAAHHFRDAMDYNSRIRLIGHRVGFDVFSVDEFEVCMTPTLHLESSRQFDGFSLKTEDPNGRGRFDVYETTSIMGVPSKHIICRDLIAVSPKDAANHAVQMRTISPLSKGTLHILVVNLKTKRGTRFCFLVEQKTTTRPAGEEEGIPVGIVEDVS